MLAVPSNVASEVPTTEEPVISETKRKLSMDGEEPLPKKVKVKEDHVPQRYFS